jgi:hypothetical protein
MLRSALRARLEAWATDEVLVPMLRDGPSGLLSKRWGVSSLIEATEARNLHESI